MVKRKSFSAPKQFRLARKAIKATEEAIDNRIAKAEFQPVSESEQLRLLAYEINEFLQEQVVDIAECYDLNSSEAMKILLHRIKSTDYIMDAIRVQEILVDDESVQKI